MILFTLSGLLGIAILRMFILNEQLVSQNSEEILEIYPLLE